MSLVVPGGLAARAFGAVAIAGASLALIEAPGTQTVLAATTKATSPPCVAPAPAVPTGPTGTSGVTVPTSVTGVSGVSGLTGTSGFTGTTGITGPTGITGVTGVSGTTGPITPVVQPSVLTAYYLVEASGLVKSYGGLTYFGSPIVGARAPIVSAAALPNGKGYWLAGAKGGVYNFGAAAFEGSAVHKKLPKAIVAIASTPDGLGYWLTEANGTVYNFGDAPFCGSAIHAPRTAKPIVAFAPTPDGYGYWLASANGTVFAYGDATSYAPATPLHVHGKVVAIVSSPDGKGYLLATSKGSVYNFGDTGFFGSAATMHFSRPIVSMAATADGMGYWLADANGTIVDFGDASADGSLAHSPPKAPNGVVAIVRSIQSNAQPFVPLPHHVVAYDISNYQCTKPARTTVSSNLPGTAALTIIEAAGWLDSANNSCLSSEAAYATKAAGANGAPYNLYLFLNAPSKTAAADQLSATGPAGTCASEPSASQLSCKAYNYGYNGALASYTYAATKKVSAQIWWLDVENGSLSSTQYSNASAGQYWANSTTLNDRTINGAYDALHAKSVTVGLYSTAIQYPKIAGNFSPSPTPIPIWIAGVPWTNPPYTQSGLPGPAALLPWCAGTAKYSGTNLYDTFAGGVPWLAQETPGTEASPFGIDPDYTC